jgi:ubiquinone/menaquinone biosynthesis C-methylase UbiE
MCELCEGYFNFISIGYCETTQKFFCLKCALEIKLEYEEFWGRTYSFLLKSPWTKEWSNSLEKLEYLKGHPWISGTVASEPIGISKEKYLVKHQVDKQPAIKKEEAEKNEAIACWNRNAERWNEAMGEEGDSIRKYLTNSVVLNELEPIAEKKILDMGSGNGYLSRKLAKLGARVTGIEPSINLYNISNRIDYNAKYRIKYLNISATDMSQFKSSSFDRVVSNFVLMNILDYHNAVKEAYRVLCSSGIFVVSINHPCFHCGPSRWEPVASDSPRFEDTLGYLISEYPVPSTYMIQNWAGFKKIVHYHRTISDYWQVFVSSGFSIDNFIEPRIDESMFRKIPPNDYYDHAKILLSCIFTLRKS